MRALASSFLVITAAVIGVVAATPGDRVIAQGASQGQAVGPPEWTPAVRHDVSRPLREMRPLPPVSTRGDFEVKQPPRPPQAAQADPAIQSLVVAPLAATSGVGFDGVGEGNPKFPYSVNVAPPDTVGEAGLTQYVQWVNLSFAVFDKTTGNVLYGPAAGNTIWSGFGGDCSTNNDGDPIVQYDQLANRWIMTQFSLVSGNYLQCVAVSQTSDATGRWYRYAFPYSEFPDYPKLSVWPDAYYITFNMFGTTGSRFTGGRVCAYDRSQMLYGLPATQVCYQIGYASLLPTDLEGKTLPPAGTPNYILNRSGSGINLWRFSPNFASPSSSTFTGPTALPVDAYTAACVQSCIPQPGTSQTLDVLGDRLMYRLSYRNLGTRESLVVNHSVVANSVTGVRWYEFDVTGGAVSVRQQGTYAPADGEHRWMGSAAIDQTGNIAVGYSIGSGDMKPSIRFAGRNSTDPLNTLSAETSMLSGTGSQTVGLSRWGDYSTLSIDPADDCTFWYTTEYLQVNGTFNWSTRIGSFKFASCTSTAQPDYLLSASPSSQSIVQGDSTSYTITSTPSGGFASDVTLSVSGVPTGATATLAPNPIAGGSGSSTLNIATSGTTPAGTYTLTVTGTGGSITHSTTVTLNVSAVQQADFTISASPANRTVKRGNSGSYTVTVTGSGGFNDVVDLSVSGLPVGTSSTFNPTSVAGSGSATLTIKTTIPTTPKGTYTLTITGTSPTKSRSTIVTLKVQ